MVERAEGMAFAAGAWSFPADGSTRPTAAWRSSSASDAARVAAIRETIEETAIPVGLAPRPDPATALELQRRSSPMSRSPICCGSAACSSMPQR